MANLYNEVVELKEKIQNGGYVWLSTKNPVEAAAMAAYGCNENWEFYDEVGGNMEFGPLPKTKEMLSTVAAQLYIARCGKKIHKRNRQLQKPQAIRFREWTNIEGFIRWTCESEEREVSEYVYNMMKKLRLRPDLLDYLSKHVYRH